MIAHRAKAAETGFFSEFFGWDIPLLGEVALHLYGSERHAFEVRDEDVEAYLADQVLIVSPSMMSRVRMRGRAPCADATLTLNASLPTWVTSDLVGETIAVWQGYYRQQLTGREAEQMLMAIARLYEALGVN